MPRPALRLLFACITHALMGASALAAESEITLPAITHKWAAPDEARAPGIDIDQISVCMAESRRLNADVARLTAERDQTVADMRAHEVEGTLITEHAKRVAAAQEQLAGRQKAVMESGEDLERRRAEIERLQGGKAPDSKALAELNRRIASFNQDVIAANQRRNALMTDIRLAQVQLDEYNARVARHNDVAAQLATRRSAQDAAAARTDARVRESNARCAGEHTLTH